MILELIFESVKYYAFQNLLDCLSLFPFWLIPNTPIFSCVPMSSSKNMCFQNNMHAATTPGEFAISLVLVISCEPVNVETESRNISGFGNAACLQIAIKQSSLFQYSCLCAYIYRELPF